MAATSWAQTTETYYYNEQWKGVESKEQAFYTREVYIPKDPRYPKTFKDYYRTGELMSEGEFVSIDKFDDTKSVRGKNKMYYKDGTLMLDCQVENGNGTVTNYWDNGLVKSKGTMKDGKFDGMFYEFTSDGYTCKESELKAGEPAHPYYVVTNADGGYAKYYHDDGSIYLDVPSVDQRKSKYVKGVEWQTYVVNGMTVAATVQQKKNYGKYYTINLSITNNGVESVTFDPQTTVARGQKQGQNINLQVLSADEYMKKVKTRQGWASFFNAVGEIALAEGAGTNTYHEVSHTHAQGNATKDHTYARAEGGFVIDSKGNGVAGQAVTLERDRTNTRVNMRSTTHTDGISHNGYAQYQADIMAIDRMTEYNAKMQEERLELSDSYLRITTLDPGETLNGIINVKFEKVDELDYTVEIQGVPYYFNASL